MKLFAGLRKIREFERLQLSFLNSVFDFDIVIEIGYHEERGHPMTLKQLFLLEICPRSTLRRKLGKLIDLGIVVRRKHSRDQRASLLGISSSNVKLFEKYGSTITSISASHFN